MGPKTGERGGKDNLFLDGHLLDQGPRLLVRIWGQTIASHVGCASDRQTDTEQVSAHHHQSNIKNKTRAGMQVRHIRDG